MPDTAFLEQLNAVHLIAPTYGVIIAFALVCLLLCLSGFASGSEIAFFSLSPKDLSQIDEDKSETDRRITRLRADSERTLATILITNNLVNVMIIMLCNYVFARVVDFGGIVWLQFLCITVLLTFLLLLFGEILPKNYAAGRALAFCRATSGGIIVLRKIFWPLATILLGTGALAEKVVHQKNRMLNADDLEQALELTDTEELKDEKTMLEGIVRFSDETAREVMTSRQDVVSLDIRATFHDVLKSIVDNNYSRIPVYQGNIDKIRGILYIKDLLPYLDKPASFHWQSLIRPPYFVPETKKIDDLLREFQANKVHIAIVVDEFGGTSGIVTLEDILEEVVGEINDEYDDDEQTHQRINDHTYVFEGKTLLSDFFKITGLDDETFAEAEGDADTLAGLLLEIKGDFPSLHENLEYAGCRFIVLEKDGRRISKIKVIIGDTPKNGPAKS